MGIDETGSSNPEIEVPPMPVLPNVIVSSVGWPIERDRVYVYGVSDLSGSAFGFVLAVAI